MSKEIKTIIAQANIITQGRYDFTVIEKRAVYFIIREVRKQFVLNSGQKTIYDNLVIRMKTEDLQKSDTVLRDIYSSLKSLRRKSIEVEDEERWLELGYINYSEHKKRAGEVEVEVSKKILPYLVELAKEFTEYYLTVAISLKNKYSQRFYEYCSQWKSTGFFTMKIDDLREKLMITEKYPRYALIKKYILEPAVKELKALYDKGQCDLYFTYSEEKSSRSVVSLKFFVHTKENDNTINILKPDDYVYHIRTWLSGWLDAAHKSKNKLWIESVINTLIKNPDNLQKCYNKLIWIQKNKERTDFAPYARFVIEEDFL